MWWLDAGNSANALLSAWRTLRSTSTTDLARIRYVES